MVCFSSFSIGLFSDIIQNARIAIAHICFIILVLAFAGSLEGYFVSRPVSSCANNFLETRLILMHMFDPYHIAYQHMQFLSRIDRLSGEVAAW